MVWRGVWGPPLVYVSPVVKVSKVPPFSISILHKIPWNSPNGEMDEGHIWVWSTIQAESKLQVTGEISNNK